MDSCIDTLIYGILALAVVVYEMLLHSCSPVIDVNSYGIQWTLRIVQMVIALLFPGFRCKSCIDVLIYGILTWSVSVYEWL